MDTHSPSSVQPWTREQWARVLHRLDLIPTDEDFRRRQPRYGVVWGEVQIEFHPHNDPSQPPIRRSAPIYDISLDGLMARCLKPIEPRTQVLLHIEIDQQQVTLRGVVRHSTQTIGGYRVGIELRFDEPPTEAC